MEAALYPDTPSLLAALQKPETQKNAEAAFSQMQRSNPKQLASELLACVGVETVHAGQRHMAAILLKRFAAPRRSANALGEWDAATVAGFRQSLWAKLGAEASQVVARALCHAVAEEAAWEEAPWPEVVGLAAAGLGAAPGSKEAGIALNLAASLADDDSVAKDDAAVARWAQALAAHAAATVDDDQVVLAVKATCRLAINCTPAARKRVLAPACCAPCLAATQRLLTTDEELLAVDCLDALVDAAGEAPAFLAAEAGGLLQLVGAAARADAFDPSTRARALEVALALCEAAPAVARRHAAAVVEHVVPVAAGLARSATDVDAAAAWAAAPCPLLPLGEADDEGEFVRTGDAALKRLAAALGKQVAPAYLAAAGPGLAAADWPTRRAALASLHALAIGAPKELRPHLATAASVATATLAKVAAGEEDPRVALEACRLVGALATASHEAYQKQAAAGAVETPLAAIAAAIPRQGARVAGALCAAVAVYVAAGGEAADAEDHLDWVEAHLGALVPALSAALATAAADPCAQKAALDAVGAVATCAAAAFEPHYATLMPLLAQALAATEANKMEEVVAQTRARAIECAALVGAAVGGDRFRGDAPAILQAIVADAAAPAPKNGEDADPLDDIAFSTLLPAAVRVIATCGAAHLGAEVLGAVAAPMLAAASAEVGVSHSAEAGDGEMHREAAGAYSVVIGGTRITVDLHSIWAKEKACDLLGELADACGDALPAAACAKFAEALAPCQQSRGSENIRSTASVSLAQVVGAGVAAFRADAARRDGAARLVDGALRSTGEAMRAETSDDARPLHVRALSDVLEHVAQSHAGGLEAGLAAAPATPAPLAAAVDDGYLDGLVGELVAAAKASDERRAKTEENMKAEEAYDDEDGDVLEEALAAEDELQSNVVNAIGWALKAKREAFAASTFPRHVLPHYAPVLADANAREKDVHAALCALVDVVEHGGAAAAAGQAAPTVLGYGLRLLAAPATSAGLRATAAYGVAVVARTRPDVLKAQDPAAAATLLRAVADGGGRGAEDDDDDEETPRRAVENAANAVLAMTEALYAPGAAERGDLVGWWLGQLPLREDDEEARRAHAKLAHLVETRDAALFGSPGRLAVAAARLADALADYDASPDAGSPTKPPAAQLDARTAPRAVRALKGLNAAAPAEIQSAYAGLEKPSQDALQKALAAAV